MTVNSFKFKCLNIMTVKRKTSLTVMNCQFEFMVTQCSVAYGGGETTYHFVMPYNLISCFTDYLLRFTGSKIGLSFPREWGHSNHKRGYQAQGVLTLTWYTYMCFPFGALFRYSDRGVFHQRQGNPNFIN